MSAANLRQLQLFAERHFLVRALPLPIQSVKTVPGIYKYRYFIKP